MTPRLVRAPQAVAVVIGDELLTGLVADTNTSFLARRLRALGIPLSRAHVVSDRLPDITAALRQALDEADLVFATGGLGPTPDDNTKAAAAKVLHRRLVLDEELHERIAQRFKVQGRTMPATSTRQALVPRGAVQLDNPVGTAPGLVLRDKARHLLLLPGVPLELERVFDDGVVPYLTGAFRLRPRPMRLVRSCGIGESDISERLSQVLRRRTDVAVSYLPHHTGVDIGLVALGASQRSLAGVEREIVVRLRPHVYATGETSLEAVVGDALRRRHLTLGVAESCTGGLIADRLTNVPGSSDYFLGGVIAYSNEVKQALCGVAEATLRKFGAVSKEVVSEMAAGVRRRLGTSLGLAVSGIAGPGGATAEKPVGLVFAAVATRHAIAAEQYNLTGSRRMIKEQAAARALDLLRRSVTRA